MWLISKLKQRLGQSRYLRDVAWQMSGNGLAQIIGVAAMPLLTRLYEPTHFATVNLFAQAVAGIAILLTWRLEYLVMLPKDEWHARTMLRLIAWFGALTAMIATVLASMLREELAQLLGDITLAPWLILAPLAAWLFCMSIGLQQTVQRSTDFRNAGFSEVMGKTGYVTTAFAGTYWLPSVGGLLTSAMFGSASKCLWLWQAIPRIANVKSGSLEMRINEAIRPYLRLAASMTFANSLSLISGAAPLVYMAKAYGNDSLGQFVLVVSTLYLPSSFLGNAVGQVYYQRAAQLHANGQPFYDLWRKTAWQLARIGAPLYLTIAILSPWAYPLIFGDQWHTAGEYASLMAIAAGMAFMTSPLDRTSLVVQAWWYQIAWNLARLLTVFSAIWISEKFGLDDRQYLSTLIFQMSSLYLIDWFASRQFAQPKPHKPRLPQIKT